MTAESTVTVLPRWSLFVPPLALAVLVVSWGRDLGFVLALLVGPLRHRVQEFQAQATGGALAVLVTLVTLSLVLPTFTTSTAGPTFSGAQLAFAGIAIWLNGPLVLGLGAKEMVLLALTVAVTTLTLATGRATLLQGAVHLVVFSGFLFLAVTP